MKTELPDDFARTPAGIAAERVLRSCVHCGMCNATCPTYQLTGNELDGPRGRIYLLKQALEGGAVTEITQTHLDRCLGCRSCETTCPSGVEYHKLYDIGREAMQARARAPSRDRLMRWMIGATVPFPSRLRPLLKVGRALRWLAPASLRAKLLKPHAPNRTTTNDHPRRMLLLSGCVQSVVAGHINAATIRVFDRIGIKLLEAPLAHCCGAVNFHLQQHAAARDLARRNIDAWWPHIEQGAETIVVTATGCAVFLRDYPQLLEGDVDYCAKAQRIAELIRDPLELLAENAPRAMRPPSHSRIAVHEPCTLQHGLKLPGRLSELLRSLGYDPQPVRDAHLCCGSAGTYSLLQPVIAETLRTAKLDALTASAPDAIYTANVGCWMHLQEGTALPVRHWIEAVDEVAASQNS